MIWTAAAVSRAAACVCAVAGKAFKVNTSIGTIVGEPRARRKAHGGLRDGGRADYIQPVPKINYGRVREEDILSNQFIRLNTIYKITNSDGKLVDFHMNPEQYDFYNNKHNLNLILKARQRGFTTVIQLFLLDQALFNPNTSCGVIAHTKADAEKFFDKKIKLAYDNIPYDFKKKYVPEADRSNSGELKFDNGSYISVGTSLRSDTLQYLHVSEFGKLCAKFPDKAAEVVSGALNTVSIGNWIAIESTGEGAHGHFYDMCQTAKELAMSDAELSPMDYKFFFYPWWLARSLRLSIHREPNEEDLRYFRELEKFSGVYLDKEQRNWYVAKQREQKERMSREYPSTPDEAFRGIIAGAPLSRIMSQLRRLGHITRVPWARSIPVNTFWDLGHNDKMAIWFHQRVGFENRWIDYHEDNFLPLSHYAKHLKEKPYHYGEHYLPHDVEVTELTQSDSLTRREVLESLGIKPILVVPRVASEEEGVNMTRENMDDCFWDEEKCKDGIKCLENVRYRFDDKLQEFQPNLLRTKFKHGYDAFAQFGHGYRHRGRSSAEKSSTNEMARENRGARSSRGGKNRLNSNSDWRT